MSDFSLPLLAHDDALDRLQNEAPIEQLVRSPCSPGSPFLCVPQLDVKAKLHPFVYKSSSGGEGAGHGVFVTKNYQVGESMCYFLGLESKEGESNDTIRVGEKILKGVSFHPASHPAGVAQIVKDAVRPTFKKFNPSMSLKEKMSYICKRVFIYSKQSFLKANIEPHPTLRQVYVARRTIKSGDELFLHYESYHWIRQYLDADTTDKALKNALGWVKAVYALKTEELPIMINTLQTQMCMTERNPLARHVMMSNLVDMRMRDLWCELAEADMNEPSEEEKREVETALEITPA
jgi:hypothetical protein